MSRRTAVMVGGALLAALVAAVVEGCGGGHGVPSATSTAGKLDQLPAAVTVALPAAATGRRVPKGFLGLSFEFQAVRAYTGSDPEHINPVFEQLIGNLSPGQAPVIRIGGDSTDVSYVPTAGVAPPPYVGYALTPGWLATTGALARRLGARMTMGLNLAANDPALAAAEARDFIRSLGRHTIQALEIGNEPNIYNRLTHYRTRSGARVAARPRSFGYPAYRREFQAIARAAPHLKLAGPALAAGPVPGKGSWAQTMPNFLTRDPRVRTMTVHRYPLRNCYVGSASPQYPTVAHLLSSYATAGLAASLHRWLVIAHRHHRRLRVDELNSVACRGKAGVSDTFASALWATDALFSLLNAGVDGVNVHTLPRSAYQLFDFRDVAGHWTGAVAPVYYGLQLFSEAAPPGSRLLRLAGLDSATLSVWATRGPDRVDRVVLIDKDLKRPETVRVRPPAHTTAAATVERMRAPSVYARSGVTLGGRTYGTQTTTGRLAPAITDAISPDARGDYTVTVPAGSAALLTIRP
jgi:hypothetical protein